MRNIIDGCKESEQIGLIRRRHIPPAHRDLGDQITPALTPWRRLTTMGGNPPVAERRERPLER